MLAFNWIFVTSRCAWFMFLLCCGAIFKFCFVDGGIKQRAGPRLTWDDGTEPSEISCTAAS